MCSKTEFKRLFLMLLMFSVKLNYAQTPLSPTEILKKDYFEFKNDPIIQKGQLSLSVKNASTGEVIFADNAEKVLRPASNLKLLTTATALSVLGKDFTYKTKVVYSGSITDSVLNGDIVIIGSGDPTLGSEKFKDYPTTQDIFNRIAKNIKNLGIKQINGNIISDASVYGYNPVPDNWVWGDMGNYYGAGIWGLNFGENILSVYFNGGDLEDSPTKIAAIYPENSELITINKVVSGKPNSGDNAYLYSAPYSEKVYMSGTIPAQAKNFLVKGSIPEPPLLFAQMLFSKLLNIGIPTGGKPLANYERNALNLSSVQPVTEFVSPALSEIIAQTNIYSVNLFAEGLNKTTLSKLNETIPNENALTDYWKSKGVDLKGANLKDGSGLSFNNAICTSQMTAVLNKMYSELNFTFFRNSLPIAGQTGTVYRLGKGTAAEGNVRVKSGTLNRVSCYSGYVTSKSGRVYSFSLMCNDYDATSGQIFKKLENIIVRLAELN